MKAVVLAAGEGVRLRPITSTRPKHLIRVGGKPLLEYCLTSLKTLEIEEVLIVIHYMGDAIRKYFGDGKNFGLKISYVEQDSVLGTGNALRVTEPYVKEDFILVYGDLLFSTDVLEKVVASHEKEKPAAILISLVRYSKSRFRYRKGSYYQGSPYCNLG